ncbi:MAG: amidohydrolase family protein, partial [Alphaproteobacteria bacterium]|nr:amidohydrolase family protein [Alphaproteobacteria bacterium]
MNIAKQKPILIANADVFHVRDYTLERCDILIEGDVIREVAPKLPAGDEIEILDASGKLALPGLINAHTHAHNNLTKALGDNWTLEDLRNHGVALFHNRTPEDQYLSAAIGAIEMLKTGCTAAYDQFVSIPTHSEDGVAAVTQAYLDVGVRAILAPAVSDIVFYHAVPGLLDALPDEIARQVAALRATPAESLLAVTRDAIKRWDGAGEGLIRYATAPVIPGECTDELMMGCHDITRDFGVGLHTHLAETKIQAITAMKRWGRSIVAHLAAQGVLGESFVGGHGVWIDDEDMRVLADRGAMIAHNPASNLKLGSGIAPVREMLDAGLTVGIGSDGSMSSDNQNMFEAMRIAALISKIRYAHGPENWIGAKDVVRMATLDGAKVLGLGEEIGALEPGRKADIVLLESDSAFLRPLNSAA